MILIIPLQEQQREFRNEDDFFKCGIAYIFLSEIY